MAGVDLYNNNGLSQSTYRENLAKLEGFNALESDWKELFRWLLSVNREATKLSADNKPMAPLVGLWQNHILIVLIEIEQKDIKAYQNSFIKGRGTSLQKKYTADLRAKIEKWIEQIDYFLNLEYKIGTGVSQKKIVIIAQTIKKQLKDSLSDSANNRPDNSQGKRLDVENLPYYSMLEVIYRIKNRFSYYMEGIEEGGEMDPSISLLLTYVRHYSSIAERFNAKLSELPDIYRHKILEVQGRVAIQDQTYVVITPTSEQVEGFNIPKGTPFIAGVAEDGADLIYRTVKQEYISKIKLVAVNAIIPKIGANGDITVCNIPIDFSNSDSITSLQLTDSLDLPIAEFGWRLESDTLRLKEGRRNINVTFRLTDGVVTPTGITIGTSFALQISTSLGWLRKNATISLVVNTERLLVFSFSLEPNDADVIACSKELHDMLSEAPVIRIIAECRDAKDEWMLSATFDLVKIDVDVSEIRSVGIYNEIGELDATQSFYPFGAQAEMGARFMFANEELKGRCWSEVILSGVWNNLPQSEGGYKDIYRDYAIVPAISNKSFKIKKQWQRCGKWNLCEESPSALFAQTNGLLEEAVQIVFTNESEDNQNCTGLFRVMLQEPEIGFGMEAYRSLFAEVMMFNSQHKEKRHRKIPTLPIAPIMSDVTMSYKASAHTGRSGVAGVRLSQISFPPDRKEVCLFSLEQTKFPKFIRRLENHIYLAFSDAYGESQIRIYFELACVPSEKFKKIENNNLPYPVLSWEFYSVAERWEPFGEAFICEDGTCGLTQSGFIELKMKKSTLNADSLFWVRLVIRGDISQCLAIRRVYENCSLLMAENGNGNSLAVGSIKALQIEDLRIDEVKQLIPGFSGKIEESQERCEVRQSSRISNRNRAITSIDYEQIVLEQFPEIEKVYCFPTKLNSGRVETRIVVLSRQPNNPYPFTPVLKLTEIHNYLLDKGSPFAKIRVCNPIYQKVHIECVAILKLNIKDEGAIMRRLTQMVKNYYEGWVIIGKLPELGWKYSYKELHTLLVNDEDVSRLIKLEVNNESLCDVDIDVEDKYLRGNKPWSVLIPYPINLRLMYSNRGIDNAEIGANFIVK